MVRNIGRQASCKISPCIFVGHSLIEIAFIVLYSNAPWLMETEQFSYLLGIFSLLTFSANEVGQDISKLPDIGRAKVTAKTIFGILQSTPKIYNPDEGNTGQTTKHSIGNISVKNVYFKYPTRNQQILQDCSFSIESGQTVALVGHSGSGKSTIIQLLQRIYDANSGQITFDNNPLQSIHVPWLRDQQGLVDQEPVLFSISIRDNVLYGTTDVDEVGNTAVEVACRRANAHNFISLLPLGYDTVLGERGAQISGGQKQRIALARALVRSPALLLLDEATSALDTESERVVQAALDEAAEGRTALIVAHRLSTIQNADKIVVMEAGRVVEIGKHEELMELRGNYFRLHSEMM